MHSKTISRMIKNWLPKFHDFGRNQE